VLDEIITAIKRKRELSSLDADFVRQKILKVLEQDRNIREKIETSNSFKELSRSAEFAELKKLVRAELRTVYGVFDLDEKRERKELLARLKEKPGNADVILKLLLLHQSSKERAPRYLEVYKRIFSITGIPATILDLGCGANPYSYTFLRCKPRYIAVDIPGDALADIAEFFKIEGIKGEVVGVDLVQEFGKLTPLSKENNVDVVFLFKVLDSLESVKRNISGKVLDALEAKWIVVSFPTVSLGGRKHIREERRAWFERLLARRDLSYEKFTVGDEIFYVVRKNYTAGPNQQVSPGTLS
jgi:16S rRNA (guanine(1405)-N(7))-methyltransferase